MKYRYCYFLWKPFRGGWECYGFIYVWHRPCRWHLKQA
jgi:hypothetical protein